MAENTEISWTDATFNPWWGCTKVSPACDNCYAERDAKRFAAGRVLWGVGSERRIFSVDTKAGRTHWDDPVKWSRRAFVQCAGCGWRGMHTKLRHVGGHHECPACGSEKAWHRARLRVFCASMGDWLDLDAPLDEFVRLLDTIRRTPELDWLLLSKRIGNWSKRLGAALNASDNVPLREWIALWLNGDAPRNIWLGATVVNQEEADRDIPKLLAVPARVRFLSIEPMLGPIDLSTHRGAKALPLYWEGTDADGLIPHHCGLTGRFLGAFARRGWVRTSENMSPWIDWVIAGGESGAHARPMHPDWVRSLRDQCAAAGVAFHLKQHGEWVSTSEIEGEGAHYQFPDGATVRRVGKKAAGRLLDGVTHDAFPGEMMHEAAR